MTERAQSCRTSIYAGAAFGVVFCLLFAGANGWLPPHSGEQAAAIAALALVAGGLFGLLIGVFMNSPIVPRAGDIPLEPGERLIHTGLANHFLGIEARGGRLALTTSRLVFLPHAINVQRADVGIRLDGITRVEPVLTLGVVPNGLDVTLATGETERFVVSGRALWLDRLGRAIG